MSYIPIDFENLPSKNTPVSAENLNYVQQGVVLAVDRSRALDDAWKDGSLNGKDGKDGINGQQGPVGPAGRSFEIDGFAEKLADLPSPSQTYLNQIWVTYEFGHLHFCDGTQWIDWGQFVGVQGERGPQGEQGPAGVFDISSITGSQLSELHAKLYAYDGNHYWHYKTSIVNGKVSKVPLGDLNLTLDFTNYGTTMMTYKVVPINTQSPSTYYIKRLANYDLVAWEGSASSGYTLQVVPASGFVLDGSAYYAGREDIKISIYDPFNDFWYTVNVFGGGTSANILVDVEKRAVQGRVVIDPV